MRRIVLFVFVVVVLSVGAVDCGTPFSSPDGKVTCLFNVQNGRPMLAFQYEDRRVGSLSFAPGGWYSVIDASERTVKAAWTPVWGTASSYPECFTERRIRFTNRGEKGRETLQIELRAYNEGVAVRYRTTPNIYEENELGNEGFSISFAEDSVCWPIPETEATYPENPLSVAKLNGGARWRLPLTLKTPAGVYASLLEVYTVNWPRVYLRADGRGGFRSEFVHGTKCGRGEWVSPWRVVLLAPNATGLIERAPLVQTLNPPCAIADPAWLKPGLAISDCYNCELRTSEVIAAAKEAKRIGAKYLQIDWGWYGTEYAWNESDLAFFLKKNPQFAADPTVRENVKADPFTPAKGTVPYHPYWGYLEITRYKVELDIPKIVAELKAMGMGLCLYVHGSVLENADLEKLFATYEQWGIAGLKPGFVAYGSQRSTDWLRNMIALAAKHHLWLDIHDRLVPDGLDRTWPNLFICEGGGGEEGHHPLRQDVALPFTRCLAGPFDYTPYFFEANRTHAHAAAFLICYPGPTAILRGKTAKALADDARIFEFVRALPWTYDETKVLAGEVAQFLVLARRRGKDWFLGGMNGATARTITIPTDFLANGTTLRLWTDEGEKTVTAGRPLTLNMKAGGGFVGTVRVP